MYLETTIWNKFEIDCSKYITSCSLSLDLMLKYTKVKIQLFKDITMFDYVDSSIVRRCMHSISKYCK